MRAKRKKAKKMLVRITLSANSKRSLMETLKRVIEMSLEEGQTTIEDVSFEPESNIELPAPTKEEPVKAKKRKVPPVVYTLGKGIDTICPICGRYVSVGVCPEVEAKEDKPYEVELPCGDRVPVIFEG